MHGNDFSIKMYGYPYKGYAARVSNTIIGNGCTIDGRVENSILFCGVTVGKDA